jgi:hypothetical protein
VKPVLRKKEEVCFTSRAWALCESQIYRKEARDGKESSLGDEIGCFIFNGFWVLIHPSD